MRRNLRSLLLTFAGASFAAGLYAVCTTTTSGPDVTVAELMDGIDKYTGAAIGGNHAYAIGAQSLNRGDADVAWFGGVANHPVIAQNVYRFKVDGTRPGGRFEQVGMSWLKHGFTALTGSTYCPSCTFEPGHFGGDWLGMGCNDPYWASLNGSQ